MLYLLDCSWLEKLIFVWEQKPVGGGGGGGENAKVITMCNAEKKIGKILHNF